MNGTCYTRSVVARKPKIKYKYYNLKTKRVISDKKLIETLVAIKIPATYTKVVLCPNPKNKLQATGYDGTGRKQYFYSKKHIDEARKEKYCNLVFLGMQLPNILKEIDGLVKRSQIDLDVLNAMALQIMIICNFRVGTTQNRDKYKTFGLTTLMPEHVKFHSGKATIKFVGKKKQVNECTIRDSKTVRMLKKLADHNKYRKTRTGKKYLFNWEDEGRVTPDSLNEFLGQYHEDITTKTWRTWFANIRYIVLMKGEKIEETKTKRKRVSNKAIKQVAAELHHTPAICKKNYLMTELCDLYVDKPEKWKSIKGKAPDKMFLDFLKGHYCLSKKWIRSRSRSRRGSRRKARGQSRGGGGDDEDYEKALKSLNIKALDPKTLGLRSGVGEYVVSKSAGGRGRQRSISQSESESSDSDYSTDEDSYEEDESSYEEDSD